MPCCYMRIIWCASHACTPCMLARIVHRLASCKCKRSNTGCLSACATSVMKPTIGRVCETPSVTCNTYADAHPPTHPQEASIAAMFSDMSSASRAARAFFAMLPHVRSRRACCACEHHEGEPKPKNMKRGGGETSSPTSAAASASSSPRHHTSLPSVRSSTHTAGSAARSHSHSCLLPRALAGSIANAAAA